MYGVPMTVLACRQEEQARKVVGRRGERGRVGTHLVPRVCEDARDAKVAEAHEVFTPSEKHIT